MKNKKSQPKTLHNIIANIAGTPGYLSWSIGVLSVLAGVLYWIASRTEVVGEYEVVQQTQATGSAEVTTASLVILMLISFVAWYLVANFARKMVWSIKRYISVSAKKFQALLMLDLTIAWALVGIGLFINGYDPVQILVLVGFFSIVGYVSLALEFYLRSLWSLPTK